MNNSNEIQHLIKTANVLREPLLRSLVQSLNLPEGSQGLDAGCGIGLPCILLAEATGPNGHITGIDQSSHLLAMASRIVREAGYIDRVTFQEGDINSLPFGNHSFDWAWSADCVGYAPIDTLPLVKEMARVTRPGGMLYILAWSSETLLPGYPTLEAHLKATSKGLAPFSNQRQPQQHFLRSLGWLKEAGLKECKACTFTGSVNGPLDEDTYMAFKDLFAMRWSGVESELSEEYREEYRRICLPDSADFILRHPDYYAFFTYSLFQGKVP